MKLNSIEIIRQHDIQETKFTEKDLILALQNKVIKGAALDVFEDEPNPNPALITLPNVLLTPHIGSATEETRKAMTNLALDNLEAFFNRRPLLTPISF
jgi:lactate dehydrogenase-like 2-hydroxyacid dehydrogenase